VLRGPLQKQLAEPRDNRLGRKAQLGEAQRARENVPARFRAITNRLSVYSGRVHVRNFAQSRLARALIAVSARHSPSRAPRAWRSPRTTTAAATP